VILILENICKAYVVLMMWEVDWTGLQFVQNSVSCYCGGGSLGLNSALRQRAGLKLHCCYCCCLTADFEMWTCLVVVGQQCPHGQLAPSFATLGWTMSEVVTRLSLRMNKTTRLLKMIHVWRC